MPTQRSHPKIHFAKLFAASWFLATVIPVANSYATGQQQQQTQEGGTLFDQLTQSLYPKSQQETIDSGNWYDQIMQILYPNSPQTAGSEQMQSQEEQGQQQQQQYISQGQMDYITSLIQGIKSESQRNELLADIQNLYTYISQPESPKIEDSSEEETEVTTQTPEPHTPPTVESASSEELDQTQEQVSIIETIPTTTTTAANLLDDEDSSSEEILQKQQTTGICVGYKPYVQDASYYLEFDGIGWVMQKCPDGYAFSPELCACKLCDSSSSEEEKEETTTILPTTTTTTTTTTTKKPITSTTTTTTTAVTKPPPINTPPSLELCHDCVILHGVGYAPFPGYCEAYIQCRFYGDVPTSVSIRLCPAGLQWNQDKLTCDYKEVVKCVSANPCPNHKAMPDGDPTGYLVFNGISWSRFDCPANKGFNRVTCGCSDDIYGNDGVIFEICTDKKAIPGDRTGYLQLAPGGWVRMPCPATLGYSEDTCRCTDKLSQITFGGSSPGATQDQCKPDLRLTFENNDATDSSHNHFWVNNTGVTFKDRMAYFNGKSRLVVPGFSNMELGETLFILIKYSHDSIIGKPQTLVANGDCQVRQSAAICSGSDFVHFYAETYGQIPPAKVSVPRDVGPMHYVMYALEHGQLEGNVGFKSDAEPVKGALERRQRGLVIGGGGDCENFQGVIDTLLVYRCRPMYL